MRLIKNIILASCSLIMLSGCNSWLDVQPRTEVKKEKMLLSQQGFREVLIGAYMRMKGSTMYGGDLSWGYIENLAQHWQTSANTTGSSLSYYKFDEAEAEIGTLYYSLYQTIADVNSILEVIDQRKNLFTNGNYELIKAEALAIRAYCHFNVLQLFGPVPTNVDGKRILSYVKTVTTTVHDSYSFEDFAKLCLADLDEAEKLFLEVDPILKYSIYELNHLSLSSFDPEDDFWAFRQHRMNYYAVWGEKARIYQWIGDKEKALEYAVKVIEAKAPNGELMFPLGSSASTGQGDLVLSCEHILNVHIYNLKDVVESNFSNIGKYYIESSKIEELMPVGRTDIRKTLWGASDADDSKKYILKKYNQGKSLYEPSNVVPLIRTSEMYFIAMESVATWEERAQYVMNYVMSRNLEPDHIIFPDTDDNTKAFLLQQYNIEFYGEGKMFYTYKRLAVPSQDILWKPFSGTKLPAQMYILPLPKREIIINK